MRRICLFPVVGNLSRLAFAVLCIGAISVLHAQQKPKENAEVLVAVRAAVQGAATTDTVGFELWLAGSPNIITSTLPGAGTGATTYTGGLHALMKPNRHYQARISSTGSWQYGEIKLSAPAGYSILINDRPATTLRDTINPFLVFKIELRADSDANALPAGEAVAPRVGDLIWQISAGRYANGLPAGSVQWRTNTLSAALLDPTSLSYLEPDSAETATAWHSDGALLELRTFQFLLYVRRNATPGTGYDIEIYSPYAIRTGSGDGPYTYNESPYRTYRISNPNGSTWANRIKIEKFDTATQTWDITQSGANWTIVETTNLRTITRTSTGSAPRIETVEVKDSANNVATKLQRSYQNFGWGQEEMISETANPDAINGPALTTAYDYHTTAGTGGYGRLKSVTNPDGSWVRYDYDDSNAGFGNLATICRPWQDSAGVTAATATAANCQATILSYAGERNVFNELSAGTETRINGTTVAKDTISYTFPGNAPNGQPLRTETVTTYTASGATLVGTRQIYNPTTAAPDFLGRLHSHINPDGTQTSTLRYKGYFFNYGDNNATNLHKWDPPVNNTWGEYRFNGFSTAVQNSVPVYSWDGETFTTVYMVPNRSTVDLDIFDDQGRVAYQTNYVFTGAAGGVPSFEFMGMKQTGWSVGRPTIQIAANGYREQLWMIGSWLSGETHNDGTYVEYTRDALGRDYLVRKWYIDASAEYPAQGMLYTHKTFDIAGRVLTEKVSSSGNAGDPGLQTTRVYNLAGLLLSETAPTGLTTTYSYANGGRTVTTTHPGGATTVIDRYVDGSAKSVTGTAQVASYQAATVNADGTISRTSYAGPSGASSPRWSKVTTDWAGRTIKEEHPAPPGASPTTFTVTFTYNSLGQMTKRTETSLADTLVAYNAWQQAYRTGLDLNANGSLDPASTDRITETDSLFEKDANAAWWVKTTTKAYNVDSSATPVTTSVAKTRLNKYNPAANFVQTETVALDIFGNQTKKTVAIDRSSRLVTETVDYPDSATDEVSVTRNGLPQKTQSKQGLVYRTYYDGLGRPVKTTDPRTDTSTTPRLGYNSLGQLAWRQDGAGNQTSYTYESTTGRLATETNPLGKATRYDYSLRGENIHTWGAATYPVEYAFNAYGERVTMKTYRDGTGWDNASWPGTGTADTTTWAYDPATGTLTSKTDAANRTVAYTYTARNQLKTRQWARGVTTTYAYSSATAEQTGITYSDGTPALSYTYTRLGQSATVGDVTGTRTFNYSPANTQLTQEDLGAFVGTRSVAYQYDSLGRLNLFGVGPTATPTSEYNIGYSYDTYGRTNLVWSFNYTYAANSNLIASMSDSQTAWTQTRTYETNRDLLTGIGTQWSGAAKAAFGYANDTLGCRTAVAKTGEVFARYGNGTQGLDTAYGYNDRSEVTSEQTKLGGTATVLAGRDDAFAFDNIGNRSTATHNSQISNYTSNALNQYSQRTTPGSIDVTGVAPAGSTVSVNSSTAGITRQGDYYYKAFGVTNSTAVWQSLNIASSFGGASTRFSFVPPTPEPFAYDLDGNLTSDGRWDYTYDAENRLVSMQTHTTLSPGIVPNADARRLEFKNDYLGRRVQKTVRAGYNGSVFTTVLSDTKSLYNGWNLIYEFDAANSLAKVRSYIWGLDWSGTLQGAGGVGGLLVVNDLASGTVSTPAYDGNGNLMALINRIGGAIAAAYEYDAFGNTLRATGGAAATNNPFRFSTKYTDTETGLVYYGLRYYSPTLGRFINKDPIEEKGGLNLYAFCNNNGVNQWDYLGQSWLSKAAKSVAKFVKTYWKPIVAVVAAVVTYGAASEWAAGLMTSTAATATTAATYAIGATTISATTAGVIAGAVGGAAAGIVGQVVATGSTDDLGKAALSGAIMGGVGGYFGNVQSVERVATTAVAGGVASEATGGDFRSGLITAGVQAVAAYGWDQAREFTDNNARLAAANSDPNTAAQLLKMDSLGTHQTAGILPTAHPGEIGPNWLNQLAAPVQSVYEKISMYGQGSGRNWFEQPWAGGIDGPINRTIQAISKVHDWMNSWGYNSQGFYDSRGNFYDSMFSTYSWAAMPPATVFTAAALSPATPYIYQTNIRNNSDSMKGSPSFGTPPSGRWP